LVPGGTVFMFALKETAIPFVLSIFTIYTLKTPKPLVKLFLYNPAIFDVEKNTIPFKHKRNGVLL